MHSPNMIRVLAVDDHPLLRGGITNAVNAQYGMSVVAEAADGEEAIAKHREHRPDITLMDLRLPKMSGTDAIVAIRNECPAARIIVLTTYAGDVQALRAMKAGAQGYLLKSMLEAELIKTIKLVHAGERHIPPEIALDWALHTSDEALTNRELDVLRSVAEGHSNKAVADLLLLSEHTVKGHVRNILSKLGANDRTDAVIIGLKRGILEL